MKVLEDLHPNDTVFPQDVPVADRGGEMGRYGGMTKRELLTMTYISAILGRAGIPKSNEECNLVFATCTAMADGTLRFLAANPPQEPSLIEKVPSGGLIS